MELSDYAQALGAAKQLIPAWDQPERDRAALQGQQIQNQLGQTQVAAAQQQQTENNAFEAWVRGMPNPTPQQIMDGLLRFPHHAEQIGRAYQLAGEEHRQQAVSTAGQVFAAVNNRKPEVAADLLERQQIARVNSGQARHQDDDELIADLRSGDPDRIAYAQSRAGIVLATAMGPDQFASTYGTIQRGNEGRVVHEGDVVLDGANRPVLSMPYKPTVAHLRDGGQDTIVQVNPGVPQPAFPAQAAPSAPVAAGTPQGTPTAQAGGVAPQAADVENAVAAGEDHPLRPRFQAAEHSAIRVLAEGDPAPGYRMLSPAEVAANRSLDPHRAYQMSGNGRITPIGAGRGGGGGSRRASGGASSGPPRTLAAVMAPLFAKMAKGQALTAGEQQAMDLYRSRQGRSGRTPGGAPSRTSSGISHIAVNAQGQRVGWNGSAWVRVP